MTVLSSQESAPHDPFRFPLTARRGQQHIRVLRRRGDSSDPSLVAGKSASVTELLGHCPSCSSILERKKDTIGRWLRLCLALFGFTKFPTISFHIDPHIHALLSSTR
jgi:hypothetical protein